MGAIFAEPVVRVPWLDDAASVGLDVLALTVRPYLSRFDRLRRSVRAGRGKAQKHHHKAFRRPGLRRKSVPYSSVGSLAKQAGA